MRERGTSKRSVASYLLWWILPFILGVGAFISLSTYLVARGVILKELERGVSVAALAAAGQMSGLWQAHADELSAMAQSPVFRDFEKNRDFGLTQEAGVYRREIERMLLDFSRRSGAYARLRYLDRTGREICRIVDGRAVPPAAGRERQLAVSVSGLAPGKVELGRFERVAWHRWPVARLLGGVFDDERLVGALAMDATLGPVQEVLSSFHMGRSGRVYLSDSNGRAWTSQPQALARDVVASGQVARTPWRVVVAVEREEFIRPLRLVGATTILLTLIASIAFAIGVARRVNLQLRPVRELADAARDLAEGGYARVAEEGPAEVSVLAEAFNRMAERLEARTADLLLRVRELTAVHRLNETSLRNLGRQAVARACLEAALNGLGARRGSLYRLDAATGELVLEAGGDADRPETPGRRVKVASSGAAQKALAGGEAVEAGADARLVPRSTGEVVCGPLLARGRPSHLLCLDLPEGGAERVRSFSLFCGAAGVALENSELLETTVASEARHRTAIDNSPHAVVSLDQNYRVTLWNRRAEALFGWQPSEAFGRTLDFVLSPAEYQSIVRAVETQGAARDLQAHAASRDGRTLAVTVSWTGQAASDRAVREWFVVIQDETEKRKLQAQLIHAEKLSAVGTLVAGVAHELNNPLAAVVGFAEILQGLPSTPREREDLKHLYGNALRCRDIVRGLLSFVRRLPPRRVRVDLNAVVDKALELVEYRLVRTEGVVLEVERSGGALAIAADPARVEQVVVNLLSNASDALRAWSKERRVRIRTRPGPSGPVLEVEDSGPGVPAGNRERLFEPFFTTKALGVGTGLGLAISSQIVAELGGELRYEDAPGGGARFIVAFAPCVDCEAEDAPEDAFDARPRARVLVVDDEAPVLALMERLLTQAGDDVVLAGGFDQAKELLSQGGFDLLILDADLGPRKGWELLEGLKGREPAVLIVTGDVFNKELSERFSRLDVAVLAKPFLRSEFLRAIRHALSRAAA